MPNVVNVLDHWIELYSSDRDEVATADYLFWFGYESPPDILITTALSALTLGVDIERGAIGTVGVRVHRYVWLGKNGQIRYKQLPPSHDWNSERISRCVSVEVRNSVFYAYATSLSTVYVFDDDGPATAKWAATAQFKARRIIGYEASTGRVAHSLDVLGDPAGLEDEPTRPVSCWPCHRTSRTRRWPRRSPRGTGTGARRTEFSAWGLDLMAFRVGHARFYRSFYCAARYGGVRVGTTGVD